VNEIGTLKHYLARALNSAGGAFARLIFLGSLRDAYSGRYLHEGWGQVASKEEIHSTLLDAHHAAYLSVLRMPLLDLSKELRRHFRSIHEPEGETVQLWLEAEPFRDLVPRGCSPASRALFISQVRTALEVLRRAPGWRELAEPIASPPTLPDQSPLPPWTD
jgi:hypothetical protein